MAKKSTEAEIEVELLYSSLSDEDAGKLIKAYYSYLIDRELPDFEKGTELYYAFYFNLKLKFDAKDIMQLRKSAQKKQTIENENPLDEKPFDDFGTEETPFDFSENDKSQNTEMSKSQSDFLVKGKEEKRKERTKEKIKEERESLNLVSSNIPVSVNNREREMIRGMGERGTLKNDIPQNKRQKVVLTEKEIETQINDFTQNEKLKTALKDFSLTRKSIKKPLTKKAMSLLFNKLISLAGTDEPCMLDIVNQSIENSWQSFYPLKWEGGNNKNNEPKQEIPDIGINL
jgi:hypothetical protein